MEQKTKKDLLYFVDHGYQVFGYDNTGCYKSEGKNSVGLSQSVIDLDAALSYIENEKRFKSIPIFLYGHSWGGYAYVEYPYIYLYQKMLFGENTNMSAVDGINNTDTPILIIHGNKDTTVGYEGAGTIAYRNEITNPNVQYKICDGERQNDHNKLFMSLDAIAYEKKLNADYDKLQKQYNENIPKEIDAEFCANVDKEKYFVIISVQ